MAAEPWELTEFDPPTLNPQRQPAHPTMNPNHTTDPLALASATPNVTALIEEFTTALEHGPASQGALSEAEAVLYQWRAGKSNPPDGRLHQRNQSSGVTVRPYDHLPDTDCNLAQELCQFETDVDLFAFEKAQEGAESTHLTAFTAAQAAEARAMLKWIRKCTAADMEDGAELLSWIKNAAGWSCLCSGWREKWGLIERRITMDEVFQAANQAFQAQQQTQQITAGDDPTAVLIQLPQLIADPSTEDTATEMIAGFLPHLKRTKARQIVRDLRTEGEALFLDRQLEYKGPCLKVRIPGVDIFVSGGDSTGQNARGWLEIDFLYEADLRARQLDSEWNEEFIDAVIHTAGQVSSAGRETIAALTDQDAETRRIEIWTTKVRQFDEDLQTTGIYCTVFSPHLKPDGTTAASPRAFYATHYLQKAAHGQYPIDVCRREVNGPKLEDTRGVPEMVRADSNQILLHQNALAVRAEWETNPAQIQIGSSWSKIAEPVRPGSVVTAPPGGDLKSFAPDRGNPAVGAAFIDRIEKNSRRRFAVPNNGQEGDHPSLWQLRQSRQSTRFLNAPRRAYWKLLVMCYEEMSPEEIAQIIGRAPLLTVAELLRCQVTLKFEVRALDSDWVKTVLEFISQIMLWDKGGLIDTAPLMRIGLSYVDSTIMDEVLRNPAGASAELYRKTEQDVTSIVLGNPPPIVEMDATAGMQLENVIAVLKHNPKYAEVIQQDPQVQENLKTYVKNLQHSHQETQLSPTQGRLGVSAMPQRPVQQGAAA